MSGRRREDSPPSLASSQAVDEERIRKVAADNPDVLDVNLARRFGISVARFRRIMGVNRKLRAELITQGERAKSHYTPCAVGMRNRNLVDWLKARIPSRQTSRLLHADAKGLLPPKAKP